jgi:hypothetical protein
MADYHTPTVIEPVIPVSAVLPVEGMFLAHVFDTEIDSSAVYYFSEQGANDLVFFDSEDFAKHSTPPIIHRAGSSPSFSKIMPTRSEETMTSSSIWRATCGRKCFRISFGVRPNSMPFTSPWHSPARRCALTVVSRC